MRVLSFVSFSFLLLLLIFNNHETNARVHEGYCDKATSTAGTLECIKRHNDSAQERLNEVYIEIQSILDNPAQEPLKIAEKNWLSYRDSQCQWEAEAAPAPGLKRIYELSCLTALTEERIEILSALKPAAGEENQPETPPEFGETPRWVNVLSSDYPKTFWRYGSRVSTDLNCDGQNEQIVAGLEIKEATSDKAGQLSLILAVASNPVTGRPQISLLTLPIVQNPLAPREKSYLCQTDIDMNVTSLIKPKVKPESNPEKKPNQQDQTHEEINSETKECNTALQITDRTCPSVLLKWNGKDYSLAQKSTSSD